MLRTFSRQIRLQSTLTVDKLNTVEKELSQNTIFQQLWSNRLHGDLTTKPNTNDDFNAVTTLPAPLVSREEVLKDVMIEHPELKEGSLSLKLKHNMRYAKKLFSFYKLGIMNVVKNRTRVNEIRRKYYYESVESKGEVHRRQFKSSNDLLAKLIEIKSLKSIEKEVDPKAEHLINLKRSELQLVLRTERDFPKIPLFCVTLIIFAELTPIVCYFIPEIAPSTTLLPSLSQKLHISQSKAFKKLAELRMKKYGDEFYSNGQIPLKFNYENIPNDELLLLSESFKLTNRFIPLGLFSERYLRSKLHRKLQEIEIDNEYLLNGALWKLTRAELFQICLDRGLINLETIKKPEELTSDELRLKLAMQLSLVNNSNIIGNVNIYGLNYLGLNSAPAFRDYTREETEKIYSIESKKLEN